MLTTDESTRVLAEHVRLEDGYPDRYIIPVEVSDVGMATGPWAKLAAEEYLTKTLRAEVAGFVGYGVRMAAADYRPQGRQPTGPVPLAEYERLSKAAAVTQAGGRPRGATPVPGPWVQEVVYDTF